MFLDAAVTRKHVLLVWTTNRTDIGLLRKQTVALGHLMRRKQGLHLVMGNLEKTDKEVRRLYASRWPFLERSFCCELLPAPVGAMQEFCCFSSGRVKTWSKPLRSGFSSIEF